MYCINSLLIGSRCIPNGAPLLSQFDPCFKTSKPLLAGTRFFWIAILILHLRQKNIGLQSVRRGGPCRSHPFHSTNKIQFQWILRDTSYSIYMYIHVDDASVNCVWKPVIHKMLTIHSLVDKSMAEMYCVNLFEV